MMKLVDVKHALFIRVNDSDDSSTIILFLKMIIYWIIEFRFARYFYGSLKCFVIIANRTIAGFAIVLKRYFGSTANRYYDC